MASPSLDRFASRLGSTTSFEAALDVLAENVRGLGFIAVDYANLSAAQVLDGSWAASPIFERNFPLGWQRSWRVHGRFDALLPHCYHSGLPVDWQDYRRRAALDQGQLRAFACLDDLGFPGGLSIPIHLPANRFAFISAVSGETGERWETLCKKSRTPLTVLAHGFHHLLAERGLSTEQPASVRLTRREVECLHHAARGYSAPATARQINRSVETVRRHLKDAMSKLGARTIAQAVAIAVACGLLAPKRPDEVGSSSS